MTRSTASLFDRNTFSNGLSYLRERDSMLAWGLGKYNPPKPPSPQPCFQKLVKIIISQQLSASAAANIYTNLETKLGSTPTASEIRSATIEDLRDAGLSKTKASAIMHLSGSAYTELFNQDECNQATSEKIHDIFSKIHGVGAWTIQNYLIFCYGYIDVFPKSDGTLVKAISRFYNVNTKDQEAMGNLITHWIPYRSCAALILWRVTDKGREPLKPIH